MIYIQGKFWCHAYWKECKTGLEYCDKALYENVLSDIVKNNRMILPSFTDYGKIEPSCFVSLDKEFTR
jgi:hypothetical protein